MKDLVQFSNKDNAAYMGLWGDRRVFAIYPYC